MDVSQIRFDLRLLVSAALLLGALQNAANGSPGDRVEHRAANVSQVVMGILSYARWPVNQTSLRLCVVGPTEYADQLLEGSPQVNNRGVFVRRRLIGDAQIPDECDALYVGTLKPHELADLAAAINEHAVLTISEVADSCTTGNMFCLHIDDGHVGFEVNLDSVARSGVRIHPSVLQLSRHKVVTP